MNRMDASNGGKGRIEEVPLSVMGVFIPLRAEHYAKACRFRGHLCNLIAAHVGGGVARVGLKRFPATGPGQPEETTSPWQDAAVANSASAGLHARQRSGSIGSYADPES